MKELIIMIGLPGSGKSYHVNKFYKKYQIVCQDDIRKALGVEFEIKIDPIVNSIAKIMGRAYMERGLSIVIDETNTRYESIKFWKDLAHEYSYTITYIFMNTKIETCIKRRKKSIEKFSDSYIRRMDKQLKILEKDSNFFKMFDETIYIKGE